MPPVFWVVLLVSVCYARLTLLEILPLLAGGLALWYWRARGL